MYRQILGMMSAVAVVASMAGCDGATGPGGEVAMDVVIEGGDGGSGATGGPSFAGSGGGDGESKGSVVVRARVFVQASGGEWLEVTRGWVEQRVEIDGRDGLKLLAKGRVRAGEYERVRVEFERVEARVEGEIRVGLGIVTGEIVVDGGSDGRIVLEREASVAATTQGRASIRVALNAEQWIARANMGTRSVSEADFRGAVRVVVE